MEKYTYEQIMNFVTKKYGKWFTDPYDLNLFGLRNRNKKPNSFDDIIGCCYTDEFGHKQIITVEATVDPGYDYLKSPMNAKGTAILDIGRHEHIWTLGLHKGKRAYVQINPCTVIRDNNKDEWLDFDNPKLLRDKGLFGIDLHAANEGRKTNIIGKWSAGCQVPANAADLIILYNLGVKQKVYRKFDKFSYVLAYMDEIV